MKATEPLDLYELLPAVYRLRDAEQGYVLRSLLSIIGQQAERIQENIGELWDDLFIETCADWVIPYIGDLVGNRPLHEGTAGRRADVARTIYYRRRKGTLPMLEELARDVTGWGAHAVAFFELLGWTQYLDHLRPECGWADLRWAPPVDRVNGPFDELSHTVDVRRISRGDDQSPIRGEGWYNIQNVGFFLWRLGSYPLHNVPARQAGQPWQYHFSPLGNPSHLFTHARRIEQGTVAGELGVPAPVRPLFFADDLRRYRVLPTPRPDFTDLYGLPEPFGNWTVQTCPDCSFFIARNDQPVKPAADPGAVIDATHPPQIVCGDLDPWPAAQPTGKLIVVDVARGRLAVGNGWGNATDHVDVWFHYGFSAPLGGGPYERRTSLAVPGGSMGEYRVRASGTAEPGVFPLLAGVGSALERWQLDGRPDAIITILDSRTYGLPSTLTLRNEGKLTIQAANGERPLLQTPGAGMDIAVDAPADPLQPDPAAKLALNGVVVEGWLHVTGDLAELALAHCTLVPGRQLKEDGTPQSTQPSLAVNDTAGGKGINLHLKVQGQFCIAGPLRIPDHAEGLELSDSIVEGLGGLAIAGTPANTAGPDTALERVTVLGGTWVRTLNASDTIFDGTVEAVRRQEGCVRFSYVQPDQKTPRRYHCQPDLAGEQAVEAAEQADPLLTDGDKDAIRARVAASIQPSFTARAYGHHAYCQLSLACPSVLRMGAEDGAEMGAFNLLKSPQREDNLRMRLQEYLPFGLEAGLIYVT